MELWHTQDAGSDHTRESTHQTRILTSTSGNAQNYATDSKSHLDFREPSANNNRAVSEPQYQLSVPIVGSNDKQALHDRLAQHKARRSSHPQHRLFYDRPYLRNPKYLAYRARNRYEVGKDGKPIWPDFMEESFQNAIVHIPPMGRHKKTQYGRLHGRNELIREWILQETGEVRGRKQVSSHIQVVGKLLKDDPHWRALTVAQRTAEQNSPDFYLGSIADQVRLQRQLTAKGNMENGDGEGWSNVLSQRHSLEKINFGMWVGLPDDYTKSLHNYSRLQISQCTTPPVPLENFKDWRGKFPDLELMLQSSPDEQFDIVVVKSRFSLMSEFPPQTSKLVHALSLDFRNPAKGQLQALGDLKVWTCVNHMYMHGQLFQKREHKQCQIDDVGVVPLASEAGWWASQFTKITQKRKEAEDTKNETALSNANDYSKSLFRSLTLMQEVYASPHADGPKKRMAVLLWVFSQASKGHAGITSWQKVVPPPSRITTNSPPADKTESSLPPLVMDTMVGSSFDTELTDQDFAHHDAQGSMPLSPTEYETSAYHSGFTPLRIMSSDPLRIFDFTCGTGFTPKQPVLTDINCEPFHLADPIQPPLPSFVPAQHTMVSHNTLQPTFQLPSNHSPPVTQAYHELHPLPMSSPNRDRRRSLAHFDMSSHHMLQAQLGPDMGDTYGTQNVGLEEMEDCEHSAVIPAEIGPLDADASVSFDSQRSMIGHMNHLELEAEAEQMSQAVMTDLEETGITEHPVAFDSPKATRPPLMAHHSFAGVPQHHIHRRRPSQLNDLDTFSEPDYAQLAFDTPVRNDFARLVNNHPQYESPGDLFGDHHPNIDQMAFPGVDFGNSIGRPRSQPVLPSADENALHFDAPMQLQHALPEVKLEQL